jgi:hypothetical protein
MESNSKIHLRCCQIIFFAGGGGSVPGSGVSRISRLEIVFKGNAGFEAIGMGIGS